MKNHACLIVGALIATWSLSSHAQSALPKGYCQVGCSGSTSVAPFNFAKKASEAGDPNGGPLKPNTSIPADEGQAPSKSVSTNDLLAGLKSMEDWSAGKCGKSLNDDSWSTIQVVAPCGGNAILDRQANNVKGKHSASGPAIPPKKTADATYQGASSPAAQKNLADQWFCRFAANGNMANTATNSNDCKDYDMSLGSKDIVAVGMVAKSCRTLQTPAFKPEVNTPMGPGSMACRKGMPAGSVAKTAEDVTIGAWVLGFELPLLKTTSAQNAPLAQKVGHSSQNYYMGSSICTKNLTSDKIAYDEACPAYTLNKGVSATFTVGPVPITVEAGGQGQLNMTHFSRVTPMWANGSTGPNVNVIGYAKAYVNLVIAKGGVEAQLTLINNTFEAYAFSGSAYLPKQGANEAGFYYTYQLTGADKISALGGFINAFVKFPVPKFIGWKWKKYQYTIFSWTGLSTQGYVYNDSKGPLNVTTVQ